MSRDVLSLPSSEVLLPCFFSSECDPQVLYRLPVASGGCCERLSQEAALVLTRQPVQILGEPLRTV